MPDWLVPLLALLAILGFLYLAFFRGGSSAKSRRRTEDFSQNEHETHHVDSN